MPSIDIRVTQKFPEPDFSRLQMLVFKDVQQVSDQLRAVLDDEAAHAPASPYKHPPMFRLGAYAGEELVGWSFGWMERGNVFYMANSGVVAHYRRRGVYSLLLDGIRKHAQSEGALALRSQHSVVNNPVIIAKLRAGFHISGLSQSAQMGTLVELSLHFSEKRRALNRSRMLPYVTREA